MEFALKFYWAFFASNREDLAFARVEFHKPFCLPVCKSI